MSDTYVYAGATSGGLVLSSGDTEYVYAGGSAVSTTVSSGGREIVSGGMAISTTVSNGGGIVVALGGVARTTGISGGTALLSGGTAIDLTISNGGVDGVVVMSGGVLSNGTILYGTNANISAGGTAVNVTANNGGLEIYNAGIASGSIVVSGGHVDVFSGGTAVDTMVNGGGQNIYAGGTAIGVTLDYGFEAVHGGTVSHVVINYDGRETVFAGGSAAFTQVNTGGVLAISGGTATDTTIAIGGAVSIEQIAYTSGMSASVSGGMLNLLSGGVALYSLAVDGSYAGDTFSVSSDYYAGGGAYIKVLCFYPGTHIATPDGETIVEALRPGDLVRTGNGPMQLRWVGQSHVHMRFADKLHVLPIRITAGALGEGLPRRDLLLSPEHALFIDGILVQAAALVNGVSILREYDVPEQFTYYHVELASHELLWAEGVQTESFVDNLDRMHFHNWDDRDAPAAPIPEMPYPRAKSQRQLPASLKGRLDRLVPALGSRRA